MAVNRRPENLAEFQATHNKITEDWALDMVGEQLDQITKMGLVDTGKLFRSIAYRLKQEFGETSSIGFRLPRYGIFLELGVGKGYPIESVSKNGEALKRHPQPWFSTPLEENGGLERLADELAELNGEAFMGMIQFRNIKGRAQ